ncbi:MAG TPA: PDZ domain-containing protein, partial [Nitrospirae bacterium]|nr:PDZ domain-containing protein [Nitrospirota bacterium]
MTLLWALILFGLLIFFHELGHFIFAKLVGVKVLKFSLGFGPRLIGKKIGETDYILSAIPLGGYVKPLGEEPGEEISDEDKPRAFNYQPVWKRALIICSGPVFNFLLAYIIFVVFLSMNLSVTIPDLDNLINTTIESVEADSPAEKAGLRENDRVIEIDGKTITTWIEMNEMFISNPGKELALKIKRGDTLVDISIVPEPVEIKDETGMGMVVGRAGISKVGSSTIGTVVQDSPAEEAGLRKGDSITSIDGMPVKTWREMADIISRNAGRQLALKVNRKGDLIDLTVTPKPTSVIDGQGNETVIGRIGVSGKLPFSYIQSASLLQAPLKGVEAVYGWSVLVLKSVGKLLTGAVSVKQIGGPILIVDAAARSASAGMFDY